MFITISRSLSLPLLFLLSLSLCVCVWGNIWKQIILPMFVKCDLNALEYDTWTTTKLLPLLSVIKCPRLKITWGAGVISYASRFHYKLDIVERAVYKVPVKHTYLEVALSLVRCANYSLCAAQFDVFLFPYPVITSFTSGCIAFVATVSCWIIVILSAYAS